MDNVRFVKRPHTVQRMARGDFDQLASLSLEVGAFRTRACVIEFVRRSNVSALLTDIGVCLGSFRHHDETIRTKNGGDSHSN